MRTRVLPIFAIAVALALFAFLGLAVMTEQPAYAKGPVKSSGGGSSSNSDSGSRSSDSGSSHSSNSSSGSSSHSSSSNGSGSSHSSSSSSSHSSSSISVSSRSSETRVYESPSRSSTSSRLDQDFYLRSSSSSRSDVRRPTPAYRKDYAQIGDIFKSRQEKRDPRLSGGSTRNDGNRYDGGRDHGRDGWYYDRRDSHSWGFSLYTSPFRYHYYCYDYRPTMCYPSPYCYYYDYYPPYVYYDRVIVIARPAHRVYVEVPVFIYRSSSDYYLTNPADKSLWAALRDVQLAWEHSDSERLMKHVDRSGNIDVYLDDEYTYSVDRFDFNEMTLDAMLVIKTRTFDFDRVTREDSNRYIARGTHVYADRYGALKSVYIEYTFERYGGEWYITAVGTSTRQI